VDLHGRHACQQLHDAWRAVGLAEAEVGVAPGPSAAGEPEGAPMRRGQAVFRKRSTWSDVERHAALVVVHTKARGESFVGFSRCP
jgi:hypothetical protein